MPAAGRRSDERLAANRRRQPPPLAERPADPELQIRAVERPDLELEEQPVAGLDAEQEVQPRLGLRVVTAAAVVVERVEVDRRPAAGIGPPVAARRELVGELEVEADQRQVV